MRGMAETGDEFQQGLFSINDSQNMQLQAPLMGTSFSRAPVLFENSNLSYSALDTTVHENSTPLRSMGIQDNIRNSSDGLGGPNLANAGSRLKGKVYYQDDIGPNPRGWEPFGRVDPGFSSSKLSSFGHGYSLYDERYQAIGLPVDPHLRIFNATNGNGKSNG
ncbi:hypothetical protein CASFOL_006470 [Castilleja foliolosa]|uniref:Uncharacterized protein n=1 Tax=Castilleja foliolosa TaxID=1961234 RepID=A0ABD3E715_9LAMI